MKISVITPSFNNSEWLKACVASVADQGSVLQEHIVQDACSTDGTREWLARDPRVRAFFEKDAGMYDAVNRGLGRAHGEIVCYLNCDEQYLPGVLKIVLRRFQISPETELFLGDVVVVDGEGQPLCLRKMVTPTLAHTWTCHFAGLSAGIFFRRSIVEKGLLFDTRCRVAADAEWYVRILWAGLQADALGFITSTFMDAGDNLGLSPAALAERKRLTQTAPVWMRLMRPWWVIWHRARRLAGGAHIAQDLSCNMYLTDQLRRKLMTVKKLRTTWPGRMWGF